MKVLFCNIGWMERYDGLLNGETISGGGKYVLTQGTGHEICNFAAQDGKVYGYVQAPGTKIKIDRIDANADGNFIDGVTIFWTATRPTGGSAVIGWYRNARVYRNFQNHQVIPTLLMNNGLTGYWIETSANDAILMPVDARTLDVPRQVKGGMGQSNIWYADSVEAEVFVKKALRFVKSNGAVSGKELRGKRSSSDQQRKVMVEKAAIDLCCSHYEGLGYLVKSVEKDNLGWDLEASVERLSLRIEVKGLSGKTFSIELTPNEFLAFSKQAPDYRLAVVTDALINPRLSLCRFSDEAGNWVIEDQSGKLISIHIRQSASITCSI